MTAGLFDQKYDPTLIAFRDLDPITGFADQTWNIDHRERIGTVHLQKVTQSQDLECLSRLQCRQRAFKSRQVELGRGHTSNMANGPDIVNYRHRAPQAFRLNWHKRETQRSGLVPPARSLRRVRPARRCPPATRAAPRLLAEI